MGFTSKTRGLAICFLVIGVTSLSGPAAGQRRGGKANTKALEFNLPVTAQFGEVVVPAGRYRVSVGKKGINLAHPTTMVPVASLPAIETQNRASITPATVEVIEKPRGAIEVVVKSRTRIVCARGKKTAASGQKNREVQLASRADARIADISPAQQTELDLINHALGKRYIKDVKHCADMAQRSRWKTDDQRFWNCVCPMAERWRLPKTQKDLRVHFPLAKGKSGLSLTVTPRGRGTDCRVWIGAKPPPDEGVKEPTPADQTHESSSEAPSEPKTDSPEAKAPESGAAP